MIFVAFMATIINELIAKMSIRYTIIFAKVHEAMLMTEMIIGKGIVIDDVGSVLCAIRELRARGIEDFEFADYDKAKDFTDRVCKDGEYRAVNFGACPHKIAGLAGYSGTVGKMKNEPGMPYVADTRSKSGKLKVTKESFRSALELICQDMRLAYAC